MCSKTEKNIYNLATLVYLQSLKKIYYLVLFRSYLEIQVHAFTIGIEKT